MGPKKGAVEIMQMFLRLSSSSSKGAKADTFDCFPEFIG